MKQHRRWRPGTSALAIVVGCGLVGGVSACGDDAKDSTGQASVPAASTQSAAPKGVSSEAQQIVDQAKQPPDAFVGPETPVKVAPGKKIVFVTCGNFLEGCREGGVEAVKAGKVLGWDVTVVDGKGDPTVWNSAVQNAVAQKVDGIITAAIPPLVIQGAITAANKAKIPLVSAYLPAVPDDPAKGIDAVVGPDYDLAAKATANWVAVDSGGKAKIGYFQAKQYSAQNYRDKVFLQEIKTACPGCQVVDTVDFDAAQAPKRLAGLTVSTLQKHPDVDYIISPFDAVQAFLLQGVKQAGKANSLKVVSYEGQVDALQRVSRGEINAADMAESILWGAWMAMDSMARLQAGEKVEPAKIPQRLFVKDNAPTNGWNGDFDFKSKYTELWGK